jgi:hypothetical protein
VRRRQRLEEELDRDIASHIAMETEDNIARGMPPAEARYAALRKFGNIARIKEDTRSVWGWTAADRWYADVRQALRRVRRSPGTAALAVLSLALAFAPSITVFSVMDRLFLAPLPVKSPTEIVEIQFRDTRPQHPYQAVSYLEFQDLRRSLRSFAGLTYYSKHGSLVAVNGRRLIAGTFFVNEEYFSVLGVPMKLGPGFLKNRASLVISHSFWMREFQGRPDTIGKTLLVNGQVFTIGGVAGAEFRGTDRIVEPDLWVLVENAPDFPVYGSRRDFREGTVWGRLP